jgi:hypothetical protein
MFLAANGGEPMATLQQHSCQGAAVGNHLRERQVSDSTACASSKGCKESRQVRRQPAHKRFGLGQTHQTLLQAAHAKPILVCLC